MNVKIMTKDGLRAIVRKDVQARACQRQAQGWLWDKLFKRWTVPADLPPHQLNSLLEEPE